MRLRWNVPRALPHGPVGIALTTLGAVEVQRAFSGELVSPPVAVGIAALGAANAWSGTRLLAPRAPTTPHFRAIAVVQYCLSYMTVRLGPCDILPAWADVACGATLLATLAYLAYLVTHDVRLPAAVRALVGVGVACACTLAGYPLQMGLAPDVWHKTLAHLPDQAAAMATFVYAPTEWLIANLMFAATLYERRRIGDAAVALLALTAPALLIATVIAQDVYFGDTSTQQIVLNAPHTDPTELVYALARLCSVL